MNIVVVWQRLTILSCYATEILVALSREHVWTLAKARNIKRGRSKLDTINNIIKARVLLDIELAISVDEKPEKEVRTYNGRRINKK